MNVDWAKMFLPGTPVLEIFVRGTLMYLGLFLMLRLILKRESGTVGLTDLLLVVLLADAAQNAMAGDYNSITDGVILVGTLVFWAYGLNWLGYKFPFINRLVHPPALLLIKDGKLLKRNMRQELITEEELCSLLREQGVDDYSKVKKAYMEGDGQISVITDDDKEKHSEPRKKSSSAT